MSDLMSYEEFRQQYELQHPASVPRPEQGIGIYPDWLEKVVATMFACASMLSGVHTVPAVRGGMTGDFWPQWIIDVVSLTSFVAIELVFFVAAYASMRKRQWHVSITLIAAFVVAMVANLQQNILAYRAGDPGTITVAITLGIGAPLIAFMAGKMFVDIHRARRSIDIESRREYEKACLKWDREILKGWEKVSSSSVRAVRTDADNGQMSGQGYNRTSDAKERVKAYLQANPEGFERSVRALADELGVGKSTVADARREFNRNGHH